MATARGSGGSSQPEPCMRTQTEAQRISSEKEEKGCFLSLVRRRRKTTQRMRYIILSFLWDKGEAKRSRHWIGWDRVCRSKDLGGLGIKKAEDIQLALHGKLAWIFMQRKCLWSRFAAARFKEDERGSIVWNCFSYLINPIREQAYWDVGDGSMLLGDMCDRVGWRCPRLLRYRQVSVVMQSEDWPEVVDYFPWIVRDTMRRNQVNLRSPEIKWLKSPDGVFTTKEFWRSFQTQGERMRWVGKVWNSFLPPKISCFVWRMIHNALATDDNLTRMGIELASGCVCCEARDQENLRHLFFQGAWGLRLWSVLADLFQKPLVSSVEEMLLVWFNEEENDFVGYLASITAAAGAWELWKARNLFLFEERRTDWMRLALQWPTRLAFLIKKDFTDGLGVRQTLQHLRVAPP